MLNSSTITTPSTTTTVVTTTTVTTPNQLTPNTPTTEECEPTEHSTTMAIRASARRFLGYGFDRVHGGGLLQRVLDEYPNTDIDVSDQENIFEHQVGASEEETLIALQQKINMKFGVKYNRSASGGASIFSRNVSTTESHANDVVCSFLCIQRARCSFGKVPKLAPGRTIIDPDIGDSFVRAGILYVGYYINIILHTVNNVQGDVEELKSQAGATCTTLAKVAVHRNETEAFLTNRRVIGVNVRLQEFGGYQSGINLSEITDLEQAVRALAQIENHFRATVPTLDNWDIHIDPSAGHLETYETFAPPTFVAPMISSCDVPSASASTVMTPYTSRDLAEEILNELSPQDNDLLGDINFQTMLDTLPETFPTLVNQISNRAIQRKALLVLGKTGIGKSVMIGCLLGHKIITKWGSNGGSMLDYQEERSGCPPVGHEGSTTKGCHLYIDPQANVEYIDCAGTIDTSGREAEICNAMAIKALVKRVCPSKVILVCKSEDIIGERGTNFWDLINKLRRCLTNPTDPKLWSSILFVVNDHTKKLNKWTGTPMSTTEVHKYIMSELKTIESTLKKDYEKLKKQISPRSSLITFINWLDRNFTVLDEVSEKDPPPEPVTTMTRVDEQASKMLSDLQSKLLPLRLLLKHPEQLIIADILSEGAKLRADILASLSTSQQTNILEGAFTPEHLYEEKIAQLNHKFNTTLVVIASYFTRLIQKKNDCTTDINEISAELEAIKANIRHYEDEKRQLCSNVEAFLGGNQPRIDELNAKLGIEDKEHPELSTVKYKQRYDLEQKLHTLENLIKGLSTDESPIILPPIGPTEPIAPRPFWSWNAKRYFFQYHGVSYLEGSGLQIPKERVRNYVHGSMQDTEHEHGYKEYYEPAWWGYAEDCTVKLIMKIRSKDSPATHAKIREFETELTGVKGQLETLKASIDGLEAQKNGIVRGIIRNATLQISSAISSLIERKKEIQIRLEQKKQKSEEIKFKINSYRDFCNLFLSIIDTFFDLVGKQEKEIFLKFISAYRPIIEPSRQCKIFSSLLKESPTIVASDGVISVMPFLYTMQANNGLIERGKEMEPPSPLATTIATTGGGGSCSPDQPNQSHTAASSSGTITVTTNAAEASLALFTSKITTFPSPSTVNPNATAATVASTAPMISQQLSLAPGSGGGL